MEEGAMTTKEPVLLVVLVEAARLRWLVAAVGLDGAVAPLLRSEDGDLATYQGLNVDDQVSFLRHRFCGILQRGCDRLWPVGRKACQFVFIFEGTLPGTTEELTQRVAEHFVEWMLNPPVIVLRREGGLERLAGAIEPPREDVLRRSLPTLVAATADEARWELSSRKGTWRPAATEGQNF
jgi:hypothetical protein